MATREEETGYRKFIVFIYEQYYPGGGLSDMKGDFATFEEAKAFCEKNRSDYMEILDRDSWETWEVK